MEIDIKKLKDMFSEIVPTGEDEEARHPRNLIFIGPPDPDSIGAAVGMKFLISKLNGGTVDIVGSGEVSHPQNRTMLNVLDLKIMSEEDVFMSTEIPLAERYDNFIFLDLVPTRVKQFKDLPVSVVVDHHKSKYVNEDAFIYIQSVGAACSLVWDILRQMDIKIDLMEEEATNVATALLMGIKTDTNDLISENTTNLDFDAYADLVKSVNRKHLTSIINYKLPPYYFDLKGRLENEENIVSADSYFIGFVGYIAPGARDCVSMFAEERLRMEGITTSVIFGFFNGNIVASLRTSNASLEADATMQKIFGKEYAGGKMGAAAANVPLGIMSLENMPEELRTKSVEVYRDLIIHKIKTVCVSS